jgi:hypothetical protein
MVVLGLGRKVEAIAGGVQRILYFLVVFRVGGTDQYWPGDFDASSRTAFLFRNRHYDSRLSGCLPHNTVILVSAPGSYIAYERKNLGLTKDPFASQDVEKLRETLVIFEPVFASFGPRRYREASLKVGGLFA